MMGIAPTGDKEQGYHADFRLSITKALGDQLAEALSNIGRAPLSSENIARVDERAGVYQLYLNGNFVYVGKADANLRVRLENHFKKLGGRKGINLNQVEFSCLYVDEDFTALAPEQLLISRHKGLGSIPWNSNGFGSKDPGRRRDETVLKANHFDMVYPIDLTLPVAGLSSVVNYSLSALLKKVKDALPYNFRYAEPLRAGSTFVVLSHDNPSADDVFRTISAHLPDGWQVSALMGYVIMYSDASKEYASAFRYYRNGQSFDATPDVDPGDSEPIFVSDEIF